MARFLTSFWWLLVFGGLGAACAHRVVPDIQAPPPTPKESRFQDNQKPKKSEPPPDLVAPPPAYGNKIVMAKAQPSTFKL